MQDVWVRWQTADRSVVRDAAAFLVTTATRLAINVMQSARSRRETCVGPWLPEPVDTSADPRLRAERGEALASGVLLLLEKLTPTERAAYVLREAFDYTYRDIANVLRLEEANARQVVTRARQHVANGRRMPANSTEQRRLLEAFIAAAQHGDVAGLEGLLCFRRRSHLRLPRSRLTSQRGSASGQWLIEAALQIRNTATAGGGTACKAQHRRRPAGGATHMAQEATVRSLMSKDLAGVPGRELSMITVEYPPGRRDPVHTHHAQALRLRVGGLRS